MKPIQFDITDEIIELIPSIELEFDMYDEEDKISIYKFKINKEVTPEHYEDLTLYIEFDCQVFSNVNTEKMICDDIYNDSSLLSDMFGNDLDITLDMANISDEIDKHFNK